MTLAESVPPINDLGSDMAAFGNQEAAAQEESLIQYCRPIELYNIIQRRQSVQPTFLRRNLSYMIEGAHERRTNVTMENLSGFPVYVCVTSRPLEEDVYISMSKMLPHNRSYSFVLPEIRKLRKQLQNTERFISFIRIADQFQTSLDSYNGAIYWSSIALSSVCKGWTERLKVLQRSHSFKGLSVDVNLEGVCMSHGVLQHEEFPDGRRMKIQRSVSEPDVDLPVLRLKITGAEYGQVISTHYAKRRAGKVLFHYLYYFNTYMKVEATEDHSCPFCLVCCFSFKGLQFHLETTHDLFNFEYSSTEDIQQSVIVSLKASTQDVGYAPDELKGFFYCARRKSGNQESRPPALQNGHMNAGGRRANVPAVRAGRSLKADSQHKRRFEDETNSEPRRSSKIISPLLKKQRVEKTLHGGFHSQPSAGANLSKSGSVIRSGALRHSAVSQLRNGPSMDRIRNSSETRSRSLLDKRKFYHAHTGQLMVSQQLYSERDSEDELDDSIASWEDRRLLDAVTGVSKDEKDVFHRWNNFVRRKRVIADGHCPAACVAFAQLNAEDFSKSDSLRTCFLRMLIKFWNHGLIKGETLDESLKIVDNWPGNKSIQMKIVS